MPKNEQLVLDYAPSPGVGEFLDAICNYYKNVGISIEKKDVLATYGGSEALQIVLDFLSRKLS